MPKTINCQLGKNGITENFIETLKSNLKNYKQIRISVLKSAREEGKKGKEITKEYSEEILRRLNKNEEKYKSKNIGFVIILMKSKSIK